nr:[FeFe] hydrogenase H-cluster maturation GTPase HydF [uncultured Solibaculum sp.]
MQNTPLASRRHVVIYGNMNAGKSSLFNRILQQDLAIVSPTAGTTTDPVVKGMELIPFGPIALVDTAGLGDSGSVGDLRVHKTRAMLDRTDLALYAADISHFSQDEYAHTAKAWKKRNIPYVLVFTKCDLVGDTLRQDMVKQYPEAVLVSDKDPSTIQALKARMIEELHKLGDQEDTLIGRLVPSGSTVVLVIPVDSEAPKGRLILPQVQLIRDCLDHGIACHVCRETELADTLHNSKQVDLVVTDSQAFQVVDSIVPKGIPLTSFSMLLANQKGDLAAMLEGAGAVSKLPDGARILVAEGCTHNHNHEDIGRVKIPRLLQKKTGKIFQFDHVAGNDFPEDLSPYAMVIQCGGCMLTRRAVLSRIGHAKDARLPITNYGVILAYLTGILPRASAIFHKAEDGI